MNEKLKEKLGESLMSVLPITAIVAMICFFITPVSSDVMMMFFVGAVFLILGISLFSIGAESSMSLIGERIGASLSKSKKIWLIALISFLVGTITTIAEPDLQVLATQASEIPSNILIMTVGVGVGIFLSIAMLRIVFKIKLHILLIILYIVVFAISFFVPPIFLPLAFDSGGVTTGPMTVPFIIALGIGAASIRTDKNSESDSFGLVALCSIGPIIAVMILGLIFKITNTQYIPLEIAKVTSTKDIAQVFVNSLPKYSLEVLKSLIPIASFFVLYNIFSLKLSARELIKIFIGFVYTFVGLTIFLTGVNQGFLPVGNMLGVELVNNVDKELMLPIMMLIGFFIVKAEPAVQVLIRQVNDITDGKVSEKIMEAALSIGMMLALVISCLRAWYGIPLYVFLIPGYILALGLALFSPGIFTGIAFDSGGVASGPMTASFILPLMIGVCEASTRANANVLQDAFGLISMVAMMPLIVIQIVGVMYKYKRDKYFKEAEIDVLEKNDDIIVFPKKQIVKS